MENEQLEETAARLRRSVTRLNRRLRQNSLADVSPAQASMLATIEKLSKPTLGDLAKAEQIQPPSVTRLVQSLVDASLCTRTVDEHDRRAQRVELTAQGRKELQSIRRKKTVWLSSRLEELTATEQKQAAELATLLEKILGES
ncbi:MAG: MarR family transcriptional regulator [Actinobacteria bacterium]|nr:MarR family transcriptional regulator [Actinomycetota bacterium]